MKEVLNAGKGDIGSVIDFIRFRDRLVWGLTGEMFSAGEQEVWCGCKDIESDSDGREWDEAEECGEG